VQTCPYIYVDRDVSMARLIQGWPKKLGRPHHPALPVATGAPLDGAAAATEPASPRTRGAGPATVTLERPAVDPVFLGYRPVVNVRHFPRLTAGQHDRPAVHELVRSRLSNVSRTEVWEGDATLSMFDAPGEELAAERPGRSDAGTGTARRSRSTTWRCSSTSRRPEPRLRSPEQTRSHEPVPAPLTARAVLQVHLQDEDGRVPSWWTTHRAIVTGHHRHIRARSS
jgi:hypothetical protein